MTADEAQGTMGRGKILREAHLILPPSCLVCAQIFIERETSVHEEPMKRVTRIKNYELEKIIPMRPCLLNRPTAQREIQEAQTTSYKKTKA